MILLAIALSMASLSPPAKTSTEYDLKQLRASLAPRTIGVLQECGMTFAEASHVEIPFVLVEGGETQIDWDYAEAQKFLASLRPDIRSRFLSLTYQWVGPSVLWLPEVAQQVGLSEKQKKQIQAVYLGYLKKYRPWPAIPPTGMIDRQKPQYDGRSQLPDIKRDDSLLRILTKDQLRRWRELGGAPSEALADFRRYCREPAP